METKRKAVRICPTNPLTLHVMFMKSKSHKHLCKSIRSEQPGFRIAFSITFPTENPSRQTWLTQSICYKLSQCHLLYMFAKLIMAEERKGLERRNSMTRSISATYLAKYNCYHGQNSWHLLVAQLLCLSLLQYLIKHL